MRVRIHPKVSRNHILALVVNHDLRLKRIGDRMYLEPDDNTVCHILTRDEPRPTARDHLEEYTRSLMASGQPATTAPPGQPEHRQNPAQQKPTARQPRQHHPAGYCVRAKL